MQLLVYLMWISSYSILTYWYNLLSEVLISECVWLYRVVLDGGTSKSGVFKFNSKQTQGYLSRTNALWVKMMAPNKVKLSYNTYSKSLICSGQKKKILSKMKL